MVVLAFTNRAWFHWNASPFFRSTPEFVVDKNLFIPTSSDKVGKFSTLSSLHQQHVASLPLATLMMRTFDDGLSQTAIFLILHCAMLIQYAMTLHFGQRLYHA